MSFPLWLHYIHRLFCVGLFTTMQPANFLSGEELTCSSEDFNQRRTRWWAAVRCTPCPCPATVLNLGSDQRKWKWSRNARYYGHMSPHPMYSRPAPKVCDEVNRSGLHMSSHPVVLQTVKLPIKRHEECVMCPRGVAATWFPQNGAKAMRVSSSLIQISQTPTLVPSWCWSRMKKIRTAYNSIALSEEEWPGQSYWQSSDLEAV